MHELRRRSATSSARATAASLLPRPISPRSHDDDETHCRMYDAYLRIFARLSVRAFAVEADSGAIDGNVSHEFIIPVR